MEKYKPYLEEEKPIVELPSLLVLFLAVISVIFGLSLIVFPPLIVFLVFLALGIGLGIILNPFVAIPVFIVGAYLYPVAFFPELAPYHPTTIFALGVLFVWVFHIILYKDFKAIKSKQIIYMFLFTVVVSIASVFNWEYSNSAFIDFLKVLILYFVVAHLVNTRLRISILIYMLIPFGVIISLYALYLQARGIGRGYIEGAMRVISFEGNPNQLCLSLAMLVPLLFGMFIISKSARIKIILVSILALFSSIIILTYSRSGFLGFIVILAFTIKEFFSGRNKIALFILLAFGAWVFLLYAPPQFYERVESIVNLTEPSVAGRLDVYKVGTIIMLKHPLTGVGLGLLAFMQEYFDIALTMPHITHKLMGWTHNLFLEIGAKTGVVSLVLFIFVILYALKDLRESKKIFREKGDKSLLIISQAIWVSIAGFLVFAMFVESLLLKTFWIFLALSASLKHIALTYEKDVS